MGYDLTSLKVQSAQKRARPPDFDEDTMSLVEYVLPFTMTSPERIFALRKSVEYVVKNEVPGDIVECGVWKGGSMMAVAKTLIELNESRTLHLFDTFDGMTAPQGIDRDLYGQSAAAQLAVEDKDSSTVWAYSPLEEVQRNLASVEYDPSKLVFVKGRVEETIPAQAPSQISILRLDTDWYESTYHELVHLYPRLSVGGVLIIDDYGFWEGARKAVDRYIEENRLKLLLNRIDRDGRVAIKVYP